jgi:hypothetical protein
MRSLFGLTAIWFILPILTPGQTDNSDPAVPERTWSLLRENEDWSWLANPALREDYADPIKYLPLGRNGWYVTLGGEIREVLEQVVDDNFGKQGYKFGGAKWDHSTFILWCWAEYLSRPYLF